MTGLGSNAGMYEDENEPFEAYCVRCRETVEVEGPQAVWTRKGSPGTRGICTICGATVFRMGKTDAHAALKKPKAVKVADGTSHSKQQAASKAVNATYVAHAESDAVFAHQVGSDLNNLGVPAYVPGAANGDVQWAGGVHPALEDCTRLLVVLSAASAEDEKVKEAWTFFRKAKKPVVVALRDDVDVPDDIRRARRIDFRGEYRRGLRQLIQALAE